MAVSHAPAALLAAEETGTWVPKWGLWAVHHSTHCRGGVMTFVINVCSRSRERPIPKGLGATRNSKHIIIIISLGLLFISL